MPVRRRSAACISPRDQRNTRSSADQRSVCLDVSNWSVDDTLAVRVIVDYAFGGAPAANSPRPRRTALIRRSAPRRKRRRAAPSVIALYAFFGM